MGPANWIGPLRPGPTPAAGSRLEMRISLFSQGRVGDAPWGEGGAVGDGEATVGGVKSTGAPTVPDTVLVLATAGVEKNLISICGETAPSGMVAVDGSVMGSRALSSSGGALVAGLTAGALVCSFGAGGIGGGGRKIGIGGGGAGAVTCSLTGGAGARKRNGTGPTCGR